VRPKLDGYRPTAAVGALLTALTAAVAAASAASVRSSQGGIGSGSGAAGAAGTVLLALAVVLCVAVAGLLVSVLWRSALPRRSRDPEDEAFLPYRPDTTWWEKAVAIAVAVLILAAVGAAAVLHTRGGTSAPVTLRTTARAGAGPHASARAAAEQPPPQTGTRPGVALALAAAVLAAAGTGALVITRRRRPVPAPGRRAASPLAEIVEWSIDDLRREPDPRRAVIAAYARMERMLAGRGLARRPFEAPFEYLGRVLGEGPAGTAPIRRLTGLFQEAKFSPHAIGGAQRGEAVEALTAIRDDLERS
jgi:LPXTG-motif cell wall-anchored protein